jgi:hypothetical protein
MTVMFGGCNVSPLSPSNKQRINNNGEIGDIKNNQNGVMSEIAGLKSRMDLIARDVENLQSGLVNSNNKNWGVQIFQGDGGLAVGLSLAFMLALVAANYRMKSEKYKKTAELFGKQIRKLNNVDMEDRILEDAVASKIETDVYKMLKN